jgi:hypothetical protein
MKIALLALSILLLSTAPALAMATCRTTSQPHVCICTDTVTGISYTVAC